jgi:hypothetical protein
MPPTGENYDTVPHETPAQREAATTAEQNESWETRSHDADVERKILQDLWRSLHPQANR